METTVQKLKVRHLFFEATKERKNILNYCYNIVQKTAFLKRIFAKYSWKKKVLHSRYVVPLFPRLCGLVFSYSLLKVLKGAK